ncbi:hypothetical protein EB001_21315, partial [bacterium]|nr:hypothetical protein [bacterium]
MNVNQQDFKQFLQNIKSFCQDKSSDPLKQKCNIIKGSQIKQIRFNKLNEFYREQILSSRSPFMYVVYIRDTDTYIILTLTFNDSYTENKNIYTK